MFLVTVVSILEYCHVIVTKTRCFGHLNRMDEERLTKKVWEARTEGLGMK
jgi:hypothetical protein